LSFVAAVGPAFSSGTTLKIFDCILLNLFGSFFFSSVGCFEAANLLGSPDFSFDTSFESSSIITEFLIRMTSFG